ncbi:hypothetical protein G7Y79_00038g074360 [Physcia stellaris]|nr:hypothetical protein G7Y79_00038g074360 [Physcia stellaris]
MSAQIDNTASVTPEGVEKMKATSKNTESVNPEEVSKPISVNGASESVEIKASADNEMEGGSNADAMKENVKVDKATASIDKKRDNVNGDEESPSKKQRTETSIKKSAKAAGVAEPSPNKGRGRGKAGKNKAKGEAVVEESNDVEAGDAEEAVSESNEGADEDNKEVHVPATPAKKGRGRPKAPITPPKTPKAKASKASKVAVKLNESEGGDGTDVAAESSSDAQQLALAESSAVTKKGTPRKRAATVKTGKTIPISSSYETAIPADKMIVKLKEEGKSWNEIRMKWTEMTGQESKGSSLPNRYIRLIANFMHLYKGDDARLLNAEAKVTADINAVIAQLNAEKWQKKEFEKLVASGMTVDTITSVSASDSADDVTTAATTTNGEAATNDNIKKEDGADEEMDEADVAGEQTGQDYDMDEAAAEASS